MRKSMLRELQIGFMNALWNSDAPDAPEGMTGRFEVYHYAVFKRIRASIEEDYPRLFDGLRTRGVSTHEFVRKLLHFAPPASWTLAEAGAGMRAFLTSKGDAEALQMMDLDEAENEAAWCEEWPECTETREEKLRGFAEGRLRIARTKTWRVVGEKLFWRNAEGVCERETYPQVLDSLTRPVSFFELQEVCVEANLSAEEVTALLRDGVSEGWLVLVDPVKCR